MFASTLSFFPKLVTKPLELVSHFLSDVFKLATTHPRLTTVLCLGFLVEIGMAQTMSAANEKPKGTMFNIDGVSFRGSSFMISSGDKPEFRFGNDQGYRVNFRGGLGRIMANIHDASKGACEVIPGQETTTELIKKCFEIGTKFFIFGKDGTQTPYVEKLPDCAPKLGK